MGIFASKLSPYALFFVSFATLQLYYFLDPRLTSYESYVAYIVSYTLLLGLFILFVKQLDKSTLDKFGFIIRAKDSWKKIALVAISLSLLFFLITLELGFAFGFSKMMTPSLFIFGFFLFTAPLVAVSEEAIYRGYIFRKLAGHLSFGIALLISAILYGLQLTNVSELFTLNANALARYLFTNTLSGVALGIVMGFYFYKSAWSLLGPIIFRIALYYQTYLSPIQAKSSGWELTFVFALIGFGAVIVALNAVIGEPKFLARRFLREEPKPLRFRVLEKNRRRREMKKLLQEVAIIAIILIVVLIALPAFGVESQYRSYAVASGSMEPTFYRGDLLIVQKVTNPQEVQLGDIVAYNSSEFSGPITHRVIKEELTSNGSVVYTTKGDNNPSPDPAPVPFSKIEGKVIYEIPLVGYFVLSPPLTISLVVVFGLIAFASQGARSTTKNRKRVRVEMPY